MKPIDVKDNTYIDSVKAVNDKDPKLKVVDHVRISKYKNIFAKGYTPNWYEEFFVVKEVKSTVPWAYAINDLNGEWKYVKWKDFDSSFNSWINEKDLIKQV